MNTTKHTPEPWEVWPAANGDDDPAPFRLDSPGKRSDTIVAWVYTEADARRIAACVNACQGFTTKRLENILADGRSLAHMLAERDKEIDRLIGQRTELRALVRDLYDWIENTVAYGSPQNLAERCDELLKRVPA